MNIADQCREMNLAVGDIIIGRESGGGEWWNENELTLLWLGKEEAVFMERGRSSLEPVWNEPHESVDWNLGYRDWCKIASPAN